MSMYNQARIDKEEWLSVFDDVNRQSVTNDKIYDNLMKISRRIARIEEQLGIKIDVSELTIVPDKYDNGGE